jgi:hypothetical protein
MRKERRR